MSRLVAAQLLRAATAIGANLEEAAGGQSKADFVSKCNIALKEARETLYWLRVVQEGLLARSDVARDLQREANEVVCILTTIVKRARG